MDEDQKKKQLLITLCTGNEDNGIRALLAFSLACEALVKNVPVSLFLTKSGVIWGFNGKFESINIKGYEPLDVLFNKFVEQGGDLLMCSACTEGVCSLVEGQNQQNVMDCVSIVGMAHVCDLATQSSCITL